MGKLWVPRVLKSHFGFVDKLYLTEILYKTIPTCVSFIWGFFCNVMLKIFFFLEKYIDRMVDGDHKKNDSEFEIHKNLERKDFDDKGVETERSVFVYNNSKCQYICGEDAFGFMERPRVKSFTIQEMFVNPNEDLQLDQFRNDKKEEIDTSFGHAPISEDRLFHFSFFNDGIDYKGHTLETLTIDKGKSEVSDEKEANDDRKAEVFDEKEDTNEGKAEVFDENEANYEVFDEGESTDEEKDEVFDEKDVREEEKAEIFNEKEATDEERTEVFEENEATDEEKPEVFDEKEASDEERTEVFEEKEASEEEKPEVFTEKEANDQEKSEDNVENLSCEEVQKPNEDTSMADGEVSSDQETQSLEDICFEIQLLPENQSLCRNSFQGSDTTGDEHLFGSNESSFDRHLNGFLNSDQFMETDIEENDDMGFIELETSLHNLSSTIDADDFEEKDVNFEEMDDLQEFSEHNSSRNSWDTDSAEDEDDDEFDILLEHQNIVKQMKMEMRNSRMSGLPTISEDCESSKVVEDLMPLKIDEKIEYKDCIEEIQKFYKSYADKMRKLDILNYQTLNAINFLQLKDSEVFMSGKKSSVSIAKAFSMPTLWPNKQRKIFADPAHKSIAEMNRDLEFVYVGQICLSWEILCWLYGKAKELLEHDRHEYHSYNRVAGEYQQFQVLLQRFVEDEPFQGPRVQNYVRKRCILRSFLQVPSIRDDRSKEKQGRYEGEKDVISIVKLAETIKESMQIFWEFLRADKREANLALKGNHGTQMDSAEIELFMDIRSDFQKKERKLKDVQRSGNCIVKKFQKQQEGRLSHTLFTSLVDLKLVARVLSLPRLKRDHLVWCQKKLSNINVAGRKVSMEPSFSLFPC